jgi:hypothetical protein
MKRLNLALALAAVALLALSGIAVAKDRRGDDHGHHGHHGHHHEFQMREAGTIASFDAATGKLTITLTSGDSVAGLVTDATEIKCEGVDDRLARRDHGGDNGGSGSGDDNGGQNEPGDDNGGEAPMGEAPAGAPTCSTASLTPGEIVGSAELRLEEGTAVFKEVELGLHS